MDSSRFFDVLVAGTGPVGLALARALHAGGVHCALAGEKPGEKLPAAATAEGFDARVYAISPGNAEFLGRIGAWDALPRERVAPVRAMKVFGDDGASRIAFDAYRAGVPALAWIVEDARLQQALWQGLDVPVFASAFSSLSISAAGADVTLADERVVRGALVAGADGARSAVRRAAGIDVRERDYGQWAVVANFRCGKPHRDTAWQWFQRGPVLALLPLPGNQVSMVWSLPEAEARRVAALAPEALCQEVEAASRGELGALEASSETKSAPLRRLSARRLAGTRVALVGDAAHVIHPLAGQGLNLGLQDARVLADLVAGREPVRDAGDRAVLRRYERSRAEPILAMDGVVNGLFRLFGAEGEGAARLRNQGLNLADRLPVVKNILIRQAMS